MPLVEVGQKLPALFLERFDPAENVAYRVSVLSTQAFATQSHWVDIGENKGRYACLGGGVCCQAFGRPMQTYHVPIWVYRNPPVNRGGQWAGLVQGADGNMTVDSAGDLLIWQLTSRQWTKFSALAMQSDLLQYDLAVVATKTGAGRYSGKDISYSVYPDIRIRDYWMPEQRDSLKAMLDNFFKVGEASLATAMTPQSWAQLLYESGYDLQNNCWPGGINPMNQVQGGQAIRSALPGVGGQPMQVASIFGGGGSFSLPTPPILGGAVPHPQPVQPIAPAPTVSVVAQVPPAQPAVSAQVPVPPAQPVASAPTVSPVPPVAPTVSPVQPIAQPAPSMVPPVSQVPLGTAPVVPPAQSVAQPAIPPAPSTPPAQPAPPAEGQVMGVAPVSMQELDLLLQ